MFKTLGNTHNTISNYGLVKSVDELFILKNYIDLTIKLIKISTNTNWLYAILNIICCFDHYHGCPHYEQEN